MYVDVDVDNDIPSRRTSCLIYLLPLKTPHLSLTSAPMIHQISFRISRLLPSIETRDSGVPIRTALCALSITRNIPLHLNQMMSVNTFHSRISRVSSQQIREEQRYMQVVCKAVRVRKSWHRSGILCIFRTPQSYAYSSAFLSLWSNKFT